MMEIIMEMLNSLTSDMKANMYYFYDNLYLLIQTPIDAAIDIYSTSGTTS